MMKKTSKINKIEVHPQEHDVESLGLKYNGELIRSYLLCATLSRTKGKEGWKQGETKAYVNGREIPVADGQKIAAKVHKLNREKRS